MVEELLTYWNIDEADDQLEELEDALITADFGPRTALKVVDALREDILAGASLIDTSPCFSSACSHTALCMCG